jgi:hypothetical protein
VARHPPDNEQRHPKVAPSEPIYLTPNHEDPPQDNRLGGLISAIHRRRLSRACDRAIALDGAVRLAVADRMVMVVADVVVAEVVAAGGTIPSAWRLTRSDGRAVFLFADDEEPAA